MVAEGKAIGNPFNYPLDQLVLIHILAYNSGVIIHAAGIEFNGRIYMFAGKSGAARAYFQAVRMPQ